MPGGAAVDPNAIDRRSARRRSREQRRDNAILAVLLIALSASFYYGWFIDSSHGVGGLGWADQTLYTNSALRLAHWHLPTHNQMTYPVTYPFLGALGSFLSRDDPFWIVSYSLLISSAVFVYRAARTMLGPLFTVLFLVLLFAWDLRARELSYASEVFAIPWNNQMLFFAFAFFFWVYATKASGALEPRVVIACGVVVGLLATTREESVLFCVPLAAFYLWWRNASRRDWFTCGIAAFLAAFPGLLVKWLVLGSLLATGRSRDYAGATQWYFSAGRLWDNLLGTIIHSDFAANDYNRISLFEAQPWLWLAPIGLVLLLTAKRFSPLIKFWVVMSIGLILFYLSGANVSPAKLRYHCLRYMSPGFIALNLATVVVVQQLWLLFTEKRGAKSEVRSPPAPDLTVGEESDPVMS